jgi:hypothetical protein
LDAKIFLKSREVMVQIHIFFYIDDITPASIDCRVRTEYSNDVVVGMPRRSYGSNLHPLMNYYQLVLIVEED